MLRWVIALVVTFIAAYFAGGFLTGVVCCQDCDKDLLTSIFGRLLMGMVFCFISVFTGGFPKFGPGGKQWNAWPYIGTCWLAFLAFYVIRLAIEEGRESAGTGTRLDSDVS